MNKKLDKYHLQKIRKRYQELGHYVQTVAQEPGGGSMRYDSPVDTPCYVYSNITSIEDIRVRETSELQQYDDAIAGTDFRHIRIGEEWGGDGKTGWFRMRFTVPETFAGKPLVALVNFGFIAAHLVVGCEGCVFIDGVPYQGVDIHHEEILLTQSAEPGRVYDLVTEVNSGPYWLGFHQKARIRRAEIATVNLEVESYWYALGFLLELAETLPEDSVRRAKLIYGLNESVNKFDFDVMDEASLRESALSAYAVIGPLLDKKADASAVQLSCCGHSHIDTAWLWPYSETIRKCSRTFSTVCRYLEQYPEYRFSQSQPQLYQFTKTHYPGLYEKIRNWVDAGRWEPIGCMWVEADTNVPSGESLVRQVLYGKRFFKDEFGVDTNVLWLPDVFGYTASLPQILKKSGVDYFTTVKLIHNQFNAIPYSSFWWQGIDGTRVLTHIPPTGDYSCQMKPSMLRLAQDKYNEKDRSDHVLYQFGWGDGGGGPDKSHLERLKLAKDIEGLPRCVQRGGNEFFADLEAESSAFPTWRGELYFELHRGTYTTQSRTKMNNRKCELSLRDAEMLSVMAMSLGGDYPAEELETVWKLVLKNQFHDVIPGSSVREVYEDAEHDYSQAHLSVASIIDKAAEHIVANIDTSGAGQAVVVFNTLSWDRDGIASIMVPEHQNFVIRDWQGRIVPSQRSKDGKALLFTAHVPACGWSTYRLVEESSLPGVLQLLVTPTHLENRFFRIELDARGFLTSIYDKTACREVVPQGSAANVFQLFEDKPLTWNAWDVDFFYNEKGEDITQLESIDVDEGGAVSGSLNIVRRFGGSRIEQRIVIYADVARVDFVTHVSWQEREKILKVAFPVNVNSSTARYEIQFGNIERPTHSSTSWDFAKFEVCGHKWADLSEGNFGVSLLNDCKYGHDIRENRMRLTLLRAPIDPDPGADVGDHEFTYSLHPHEGDYANGGTVNAGYELNVPLRAFLAAPHPGEAPATASMFRLDSPNVILDAVKKAEDSDSIILRLYEAHNQRGTVSFSTEMSIREAWECDLMENDIEALITQQHDTKFEITPFEIKTIRLIAEQ